MKSIANNHLPFSIHKTVQKVSKELFDSKHVLFKNKTNHYHHWHSVYLVIFIFKPKRLIFRSDLSLKLSKFGAKQLLSVRHP